MKYEKNDWYQETFMGLTLAAFMGTVSLFFAGILIAQINTFKDSIRFPIVLLAFCTVALIFSSIIYANASGHVTNVNWPEVQKHNKYANLLSEFFGINLFLISIPLVIGAVTTDQYIRLAIDVVVLASIFIYTISTFSILSRMYGRVAKYVTGILLVAGSGILLIAQDKNYHNFIALGMILTIVYALWVMTLFPRNNRLTS